MSETKKKSKERKNFKINSTSVFCATVVHCEENHYVLKKVVIYGKDEKGMLFEGEEDHVNIFDAADVELLTNIGVKNDDKIQFNAEVYKYVRQNGSEDYGLKNFSNVKKIIDYITPKEEDLLDEAIQQLVCETCLFVDRCYGFCIANEYETNKRFNLIKIAILNRQGVRCAVDE